MACVLLVLGSHLTLRAQVTEMVMDLSPGSSSSPINYLTPYDGTLYLQADNITASSPGSELYRATQDSLQLAADIFPNSGNSEPRYITVWGSQLYMAAYDQTGGDEVWRFDGTTATQLADIFPGNFASPAFFTVWNDQLFFTASEAIGGIELWMSSDSATSTQVADINPGIASSSITELLALDTMLVFSANDGTNGEELWMYNGTTTAMLADINPAGSSQPRDLTWYNGALYFVATDGTNGRELWKWDGTSASLVADLNPGSGNSGTDHLIVYNNALYFKAYTPSTGIEPMKYDGTTVSVVKDINPGTGFSNSGEMVIYNNALYYQADNPTNGKELWCTQDTTTTLVADTYTGGSDFSPELLTVFDGILYMKGTTADGAELWQYNGTALSQVADINPAGSSSPAKLTATEHFLYFTADDGTHGRELWRFGCGPTTETVTMHACDSMMSPSGNTMWYTSGTYVDSLVNADGCDSILTVNLTVGQLSRDTITVMNCGSYIGPAGNTQYNVSGVFNELQLVPNASGCDSIITIFLTINQDKAVTLNPTVCGEYIAPWGDTLSSSGIYVHTEPTAAGCDSVTTVNLSLVSIADAAVTANTATLCTNDSTSIQVMASEPGINYMLRNNSNDSVLGAAVAGTGGTIAFPTGPLTATASYNVYASTAAQSDSLGIDFDGINDRIQLASAGIEGAGTSGFTIMGWIKTPATGTRRSIMTIGDSTGAPGAGAWFFVNASNKLAFDFSSIAGTASSAVVADNSWHHVAATYNGSVIRLYIDGVADGASAKAGNIGTGGVFLGSPYSHGSNFWFFQGAMDNVSYWNTVLSASDIQGNQSTCFNGTETGLVAYYAMDDQNGTIQSIPGNNNPGVLYDMDVSTDYAAGAPTACFGCTMELSQVVTVNVQSADTSSQTLTLCAGDSIVIGSTFHSSTGTYMDTLTNQFGCDSVVTTNLTVDALITGSQTLSECDGFSITVGGNTYTSTGVYTDTLTAGNGCDSVVTTNLTVAAPITGSQTLVECPGFTITVGGNVYDTTGVYTDTLMAGNGCDSVVTTNLTVHPVNTVTQNVGLCAGDSITVGTNTYSTAGNYTDTLMASTGCDSIVTTNLSIDTLLQSAQTLVECFGFSLTVGSNTYDSTGVYMDTLIATNGCDSIVTTDLTVMPLNSQSQTLSECAGFSIAVGGNTYDSTGTYIDTLMAANGCDSVVTTNLTILSPITASQTFSECVGFSITVGGNTYDSTDTYIDTLMAANGCDSVVTTNLTILSPTAFSQTFNQCVGFSVTVGGNTYDSTGTYIDTLMASNGCDSVVTTNLTIVSQLATSQTFSECAGFSVTVGTNTYDSTGIYMDTLLASSGCDSVVTTNLTILLPAATNQTFNECAGFSITVGSNVYDSTGVYIDTLIAANGCDSVVTTNLTVSTTLASTQTLSECNGFSITVGSNTYSSTGIYTDTLLASAGCDSVVTTDLTIVSPVAITQTLNECDGFSITVGNNTYDSTGIYTDTLVASSGCDSIVTTDLTIGSPVAITQTLSECDGFSITVGSSTYNSTGIYQDTLIASTGCDSVVTTDLTVAAPISSSQDFNECSDFTITVGGNTYSATGTYTDVLTAASGCDSTVTTNLTIEEVDIAVTAGGDSLVAAATGATFQWLDCDNNFAPLAGETNAFFTATQNGNYAVEVSTAQCSDTSACFAITGVGTEQLVRTPALLVYPNPARNVVSLANLESDARVQMHSTTGQRVYAGTAQAGTTHQIILSHLPAGVYFITVQDQTTRHQLRVIKQ